MGVSGRIEDFSVVDVMQYILASEKSGTLYIQRGGDESRVYFHEGHIVRAARPGLTNIGDMLIQRGVVSKLDIQSAVSVQESVEEERKPLGMILEEMGVVNHEALKDAVVGQIREVIYDLVTWEEGDFRFELGTYDIPDDISVSPDELIPPEEIDTQAIMLEAVRAFEESRARGEDLLGDMQRRWEEVLVQGMDAPLPEGGEKEEIPTPVVSLADSGMALFFIKELLGEARKNGQGQSISVHFLRILAEYVERAIFFLIRESELLGLGAIGTTEDKHPLNEVMKNLRVPFDENSLPVLCVNTRSVYSGAPPAESWITFLYRRIGTPALDQIIVLPIAGVDRVIGLVYGDNGPVEEPIQNLELVEIAAGIAGVIFENAYYRKRLQKKPQ